MKMQADLYSWIFIIWIGLLQSCLTTVLSLWKANPTFQNMVCPETVMLHMPTNSLGRCIVSCNQINECMSVFYIAGQVSYCHIANVTLSTTSGCIAVSNATLYSPSNEQVQLCPDDGVYHTVQLADGPYTYMISNEKVIWETAKDHCEGSGGFLAKVSTVPKLQMFTDIMTTCAGFGGNKLYFVDGSNANADATWKWHDGEFINMNSTFWHTNRPNNPEDDHCVALEGRQMNWKFNDKDCTREMCYICE